MKSACCMITIKMEDESFKNPNKAIAQVLKDAIAELEKSKTPIHHMTLNDVKNTPCASYTIFE